MTRVTNQIFLIVLWLRVSHPNNSYAYNKCGCEADTHIHAYTYTYINMYMYVERERQREKERVHSSPDKYFDDAICK